MGTREVEYTKGHIGRMRAVEDFLPAPDDLRVSDRDLAEIRRRRVDSSRKLVSHEEARARIKRLGG
jgi:hypothetical protein